MRRLATEARSLPEKERILRVSSASGQNAAIRDAMRSPADRLLACSNVRAGAVPGASEQAFLFVVLLVSMNPCCCLAGPPLLFEK